MELRPLRYFVAVAEGLHFGRAARRLHLSDEIWRNHWNGGEPRQEPVVRAVQECVQSVLWNGTVGLAPLGHDLGELAVVPVTDLPPSPVVIAWRKDEPLVRSFVEAAAQAYR